MIFKRLKVNRLRAIRRLLGDLFPVVWCAYETRGIWRIETIDEFLNFIYSDLSDFVLGYVDVWTLEDEEVVGK